MKREGNQAEWHFQRVLLVMVLLVAGACRQGVPEAISASALPSGVVARVGTIDITAEEVARIAAVQGITSARAGDLAVHDALFACAALERGLDAAADVRVSIEGELARRVLRKTLAEARREPPTEDELRDAAARRWLEVDRPEGFRTVHAVVLIDWEKAEPDARARARTVAEAIDASVRPISQRAASLPLPRGAPAPVAHQLATDDPDPLSGAFRMAVAGVAHEGVEVRVEPMPPISAEGRILVQGEHYVDPMFASATSALRERGMVSPVSPSSFGLHVIMLLERTPAQVWVGEARTARLRDDIANDRARSADKHLLVRLRATSVVNQDAPGLLDLVSVAP